MHHPLSPLTSCAAAQPAPERVASDTAAHSAAPQGSISAVKSAADVSVFYLQQQQQQQQQQQLQQLQQKHQHDKENAAAAAREQADQRSRDAQSRAAELRQLEQLLGATVASSGLKHLDLQQLNVSAGV